MTMMTSILLTVVFLFGCSDDNSNDSVADHAVSVAYLDNTGRDDVLSGGVKMIPVTTSNGSFRVWTRRVGNNPTIKLLLLHGGPGVTHEYLEAFDSFFPAAGIEYYYYDQLGSYYSDQPVDPDLWQWQTQILGQVGAPGADFRSDAG